MELEQEVVELEMADKDLGSRNPSRLIQFLVYLEEYAWQKGMKKMVMPCSFDPAVKFKVEGRRVYREIHKGGSCYREEHLKTPLNGIPVYSLEIRDNREKVPR